jgi:hypothetical protein
LKHFFGGRMMFPGKYTLKTNWIGEWRSVTSLPSLGTAIERRHSSSPPFLINRLWEKKDFLVPFRVTRLGEFSPIGRLFALGISLKITEVALMLGLLSSTVKVVCQF